MNERKRKADPQCWARNIRKKARQSGETCVNTKGQAIPARKMGSTCKCSMDCVQKVSERERNRIFELFWKLSDAEKKSFYNENVAQFAKKSTKDNTREHTREYSFVTGSLRYRVCKTFFLNTLAISEARINYFFKTANENPINAHVIRHGLHTKTTISNDQLEEIKSHIASFPVLPAHYARADTNKEFFEDSRLTLRLMFNLYCEKSDDPVGITTYSSIFKEFFNLGFSRPKKDQCWICTMKKSNKLLLNQIEMFEKHHHSKELTRREKHMDNSNKDPATRVLSHDPASVFLTPKTEIGLLFYKRKITIFNSTSRDIKSGVATSHVWDESTNGRKGNDVASCLYDLLRSTMKSHPNTRKIIVWADSCVSQNRNKMTAASVLHFMHKHPQLKEVRLKWSEKNHSVIQEVDCVHSVIEKRTKKPKCAESHWILGYFEQF